MRGVKCEVCNERDAVAQLCKNCRNSFRQAYNKLHDRWSTIEWAAKLARRFERKRFEAEKKDWLADVNARAVVIDELRAELLDRAQAHHEDAEAFDCLLACKERDSAIAEVRRLREQLDEMVRVRVELSDTIATTIAERDAVKAELAKCLRYLKSEQTWLPAMAGEADDEEEHKDAIEALTQLVVSISTVLEAPAVKGHILCVLGRKAFSG